MATAKLQNKIGNYGQAKPGAETVPGQQPSEAGITPAAPTTTTVPLAPVSGAVVPMSDLQVQRQNAAPAAPSASTPRIETVGTDASGRQSAVDEYLKSVGDQPGVEQAKKDYAASLSGQESVSDFLKRAQQEQGIPDLLTSLDTTRQAAAQSEVAKRAAERQTASGTGFVTQSGLAGLRAADSKEYIQKLADLSIIENATVGNINARNALIAQSLAARKQDAEEKKAAFEARIASLAVSDDRKEAMKALLNARLSDIAKKEESAAAVALAKAKDLLATGDVNSTDPDLRKKAIVNAINAQVEPYAKYGVTLDVPAEAHAAQIMAAMDAGQTFADAFRANFSQPFQAKTSVANIKDQLSGGEWKTTSVTTTDAYGNRKDTPVFYRMKGNGLEAKDLAGNPVDPTLLQQTGASAVPEKPAVGTWQYNKAYGSGNQKLRDDMASDPTVKNYQETMRAKTVMDQLAGQIGKTKNPAAIDQALVMTFNKLLDPGSVVREGEYARTEQGQALLDQASAWLTKLQSGGAGITDETRKQMVATANTLYGAAEKLMDAKRNTFRQSAAFVGADPEFVDTYLGKASAPAKKTAADYYGAVKGGSAPAAAKDIPDDQILAGRKVAAKTYDIGKAAGEASETVTAAEFWKQYKEQRAAFEAAGDMDSVKRADALAEKLQKQLGIPDDTSELAARIDSDIKRVAPSAKLDGRMISESAAEAGVDPRFVAAFLANDSGYGTRGIGARNNNPGNVGQFDRLGTTPTKGYATIQEGIRAAADNLAKRVAAYKKATGRDDPTVEELASGKTKGGVKFFGPYMTDAQGPTRVRAIYNRINNAA